MEKHSLGELEGSLDVGCTPQRNVHRVTKPQNDYQVTQRGGKGVHCIIPVQGHHIERGDINNNDGVKPRN